jgi:hypothetical protein
MIVIIDFVVPVAAIISGVIFLTTATYVPEDQKSIYQLELESRYLSPRKRTVVCCEMVKESTPE